VVTNGAATWPVVMWTVGDPVPDRQQRHDYARACCSNGGYPRTRSHAELFENPCRRSLE
jgi:hypothetical protein